MGKLDTHLYYMSLFFLVHVLVINLIFVNGQEPCIEESPCKCVFSNGQFIDLSSLGNRDGTARFSGTSKLENTYLWNPCYAFKFLERCQNAAICEIHPTFPVDEVFTLGYQDRVNFTTNPNNNSTQLVYSSQEDGKKPVRTSYISLICAENDDNSTFVANGETVPGSNNYYFELHSPMACLQDEYTTAAMTTTSLETTEPTNPVTTATSQETSEPTTASELTSTYPEPTSINPGSETPVNPTSESPTTENPMSESPTTENPTSESPTTENPTSESPTTENPTSESPTSENPNLSTSEGTSVVTSPSHSSVSPTSPPTTHKPSKSKSTAIAVSVVSVLLVVGVAVGLTLYVLKKKGKICKPPEYDNL